MSRKSSSSKNKPASPRRSSSLTQPTNSIVQMTPPKDNIKSLEQFLATHSDPKKINTCAIIVQKHMRGWLQRRKTAELVFHKVWNLLDTYSEYRAVTTEKDLHNLHTLAVGEDRKKRKSKSPKKRRSSSFKKQQLQVPDDYSGPSFPEDGQPLKFTKDYIDQLITYLRSGKILPYGYFLRLLMAAKDVLSKKPNLNECSIPKDGKLVVVGDTHGQLEDLLTVLAKNGRDFPHIVYVFNGDFVDRGPRGAEVLIVLLTFLLTYPDSFYMNRGNHEERHLNEAFNFEKEMLEKYDKDLFEAVQDVFTVLPLGTLIEKKVLVIHGGLFKEPDVTLDDIRNLNRISDGLHMRDTPTRNDSIVEQLMWSDPREIEGFEASDRGAGIYFGSSITEDFCKRNKLDFIIRSHEMMQEGYQRMHNNQCLTVFSASNYCATCTNMGGVIVFFSSLKPQSVQTLTPTFITYKAEPLKLNNIPPTGPPAGISISPAGVPTKHVNENVMSIPERVKEEVLQTVREYIYETRHELFLRFQKEMGEMDLATVAAVKEILPANETAQELVQAANKDGKEQRLSLVHKTILDDKTASDNRRTVTKYQWVMMMKEELGFDFPWFSLLPHLTEVTAPSAPGEPQRVDFIKFLYRFQINILNEAHKAWEKTILDQLTLRLYHHSHDMMAQFLEMDENHDGRVSYSEFVNSLRKDVLQMGLTDGQLFDLMRCIDVTEDGFIDLREFTRRFKVIPTQDLEEELESWIVELGEVFSENRDIIKKLFKDENSKVSAKTFENVIRKDLKMQYTAEEYKAIMSVLDPDKKGEVTWTNFSKSFRMVDEKADTWQVDIIQRFCSAIFSARLQLRRAFRMMDTNDQGYIDRDQFYAALYALNTVQKEKPISRQQANELFDFLDVDKTGKLEYSEFLRNFEVVDLYDVKTKAIPKPAEKNVKSSPKAGPSSK